MPLGHEDHLTLDREQRKLVQNLDPNETDFFEYLLSKSVLSWPDVEIIQNIANKHSEQEAIRKLLAIYRRKASSLEPLISALEKCCYHELMMALSQQASADNAALSPTTARKRAFDLNDLGGVPRQPPVYVERDALLDNIKQALTQIAKEDHGGWVVLHGMGGIGKSVAAAAALTDPAITGCTFTEVFWLNIGPHGDDELTATLEKLFYKIERTNQESKFSSEQQAITKLTEIFVYDCPWALVVLDDVWSERVVRAFNQIRCRVMVTTRHSSLMNVIDAKKLMVHVPDSGFDLDESMRALAQWTNMDIQSLPSEAAQLYKQTEGHPFEISLIGSLLRDKPSRWKHYCQMLRDRKLEEIRNRSLYKFDHFAAVVQISLDNLPDEYRDYFYSLGVFQRGTEISSEALSVFWDKTKEHVEDIMRVFVQRSLVEKRGSLSSWACDESYRIHILLHEVIKSINGLENQKILHKIMLDRYLSKADGRWDKLAHDGYIHQYCAYHMYRAGSAGPMAWEIFLHLPFVVEMLTECGPVHTLTDFTRYANYIKQKDSAGYQDFQNFIWKNTDKLNNNETNGNIREADIFNLALNEPAQSTVHRQAEQLDEELHFSVPKDLNNSDIPVSARFLWGNSCVKRARWILQGECNACLVIYEDGSLRICSTVTGKEIWKTSVDQPTACISVSSDFKRVLVCGSSVFTLDLTSLVCSLEHDAYAVTVESGDTSLDPRTPSPLLNAWPSQQTNSNSNPRPHPSVPIADMTNIDGRNSRRYHWCEISQNGTKGITADSSNCIVIWDLLEEKKATTVLDGHSAPVNCCKYNRNDNLIVSVSDDGTGIVWNAMTGQKIRVLDGHGKKRVSDCCWINRGALTNCVLTNSYTEFLIWDMDGNIKLGWNSEKMAVCSDVSECGNYVATGLVDGSVLVWQLQSNTATVLIAFRSRSNGIPTSIVFHPDNSKLLTARKNGIVEVWELDSTNNHD